MRAKFLVLITVLFMVPSICFAQDWQLVLSNRHTFRGDSARSVTMQNMLDAYVGNQCGVWTFGYNERTYIHGEAGSYFSAVAGPYCNLAGTFGIGVGAGAERMTGNTPTLGRFAGTIYVGDPRKLYAEFYYENGASGEPWYELNATYQSRYITVGILWQADVGIGPQFALRVEELPIEIFMSPMYDYRSREMNMTVGLQAVFRSK